MSAGDDEPLGRLALMPEPFRSQQIARMRTSELRAWNEAWDAFAHAGQYREDTDWRVWLIRAGRGFGKTRAGAEWVLARARAEPELRVALVGANIEDVRRVMIEGVAGLLACAREDEPLRWRVQAGEIDLPRGGRGFVYSAQAPEKLRGPEHDYAWCDELGKWGRGGEAAWDNLMMGLRRGEKTQVMVTTTPRQTVLMRRVRAQPQLVESTGRTRDNVHLPGSFIAAMQAEYGGTRLGRQELDGELVDEVEGALWPRGLIEASRVRKAPALVRVVVGVDPPASATGDACGIVAVGEGADGVAYVLADASVQGASPERWARAVARCAKAWKADRVIAEVNQGGDMVKSVLAASDVTLPVTAVRATRGKVARAEPVAALYEADKVRHAGVFAGLEDEMCGLQLGGGYQGPGRSPDRADALVWALTELMLRKKRGVPGVCGF